MSVSTAGHAGLATLFFGLAIIQISINWQSPWLAVDAGFFVFNVVAAINSDAGVF